jgi:hypothetical protein
MRFGHISKALCAHAFLVFLAGQAVAAPCVNPPLGKDGIDQFRTDPTGLVAPTNDTRTVEATVRDLAGTDPNLAADLVHVAQDTTPRFRTAIAAGLAQAAIACTNVDQEASLLIQQAVASFDDGQFQEAFAAVSGDLSTAATEAALSSAVGAVGSVVIVNPNVSSRTTTNPGGGGSLPLVQITSAAAPFIASTPSTTVTAASPVSPTR